MAASAERAPEVTNSFEERNQVTEFADDQAAIVEAAPGETPLRGVAMAQHTDAAVHDVISYMQRPQMIGQYIFKCEQTRNTLLNDKPIIIPDALLRPMIRAKLDGFTSFRATAVLKLQVNAQPFQAGRLLMYSCPMPDLVSPRDRWLNQHVSLAQQLHNVQIDVAQQTEIVLRVPFISPFNSYDLIHGQWAWSAVNIMVYSPLNETEQTNLECLLWGHFEDVELGAPTSGRIWSENVKFAKQQSGTPKEPSPKVVAQTRAAESSGFIQPVTKGLKSIHNTIGNFLPFLKPVTDIQQGLIDVGAPLLGPLLKGITGLFGFSKPILSHSGNTVVNRPTQFFANSDGIDHSHVLSLQTLNAVDEYPALGGTDLDETSLSFLKSIPQYIGKFDYGKNSHYGTELFRIFVSPTAKLPLEVNVNKNTGVSDVFYNVSQPTVLNYISAPFGYWTGSLVYTLRFVKTRFHSGRVEISYHPFVAGVDTDRMDYVYRLVVDLRDNSEVSFSIPYIAPTPWKVMNTAIDIYDDGKQTWEEVGATVTGVLYVRALTPLICASSIIGNQVECVVEMRAGADYYLQAPIKSPYLPISFYNKVAQQQSGVFAFPGTSETRTLAIEGKEPPSISGSENDVNRPSTERYCAGETFESFTALSRRFAFVQNTVKQPDKVISLDPASLVRAPYLLQGHIYYGDTPSSYFTLGFNRVPSPLSYVSGLYVFYRGGLRLKVFSQGKSSIVSTQLSFRPDYSYDEQFYLDKINFIGPIAYEQPNTKNIAEFQVPYYSPTIITVPYPEETIGKLYSQPQISAFISTNDTADTTLNIALAAADDLSFHMFIGIPLCVPLSIMSGTREVEIAGQPHSFPKFNKLNLSVDPTHALRQEGDTDVSIPEQSPFGADPFKVDDLTPASLICGKKPEKTLY